MVAKTLDTDILILGSGGAGLFAAFGTLLVSASFGRGFVHWAQGRRRS